MLLNGTTLETKSINLLVQNMHNYTWLVDNFYLAQHFHLDSSSKLNIIDHTFIRYLLAQRTNYVLLAQHASSLY